MEILDNSSTSGPDPESRLTPASTSNVGGNLRPYQRFPKSKDNTATFADLKDVDKSLLAVNEPVKQSTANTRFCSVVEDVLHQMPANLQRKCQKMIMEVLFSFSEGSIPTLIVYYSAEACFLEACFFYSNKITAKFVWLIV